MPNPQWICTNVSDALNNKNKLLTRINRNKLLTKIILNPYACMNVGDALNKLLTLINRNKLLTRIMPNPQWTRTNVSDTLNNKNKLLNVVTIH